MFHSDQLFKKKIHTLNNFSMQKQKQNKNKDSESQYQALYGYITVFGHLFKAPCRPHVVSIRK